ncbi:acyltransferase family protein [Novosphingobium sp. Leaf2]|uniref:acyltransferase family protein n=1 Tax=Novosphingobium sp. Leaf2 TaxID=1735670 RepID=UPI0006F85DE8|nr:acyltransferase family protein [Novosphingobium sp. Leaf2]KQM14821.1 hypothetical protein ASE49_11735 [Novosphingobium sp. Leaf2]
MRVQAEREDFPDFCKGVLIALVVFGHAIQYVVLKGQAQALQDPVFSAIYLFHMPLFMALSGYFATPAKLRKVSLPSVALVRGGQILRPMMTWVALTVLAHIAIDLFHQQHNVVGWAKFAANALVSSYWFLWAVFGSYLTLRALLALPLSPAVSVPVPVLILALLPLHRLPLVGGTLADFAFMFPFFCAGSFLGGRRKQRPMIGVNGPARYGALAACAAATVTLYLRWTPENYVYVNRMDLIHQPGAVIAMLAAGVVASVIVIALTHALYTGIRGSWIAARVVAMGQLTLQIYLAQGFFFVIVGAFPLALAARMPYLAALIAAAAITLFVLIGITAVVKFSRAMGNAVFRQVWGMELRRV